jgi:hypothetical protein
MKIACGAPGEEICGPKFLFVSQSPPSSGQEIYVTSSTIAHTRDRLDNELAPFLSFFKGLVPETAVGGTGFGAFGTPILGGSYEAMRDWAETTLGDAVQAVESWAGALDEARRNWRAAEEASAAKEADIVRYL